MNEEKIFWKNTPIHFIDPEGDPSLQEIIEALKEEGFAAVITSHPDEYFFSFAAHSNISCIVMHWNQNNAAAENLIKMIRYRNEALPIFLMTEKHQLKDVSSELLKVISGYIWKLEDTPRFIAGRIKDAAKEYITSLMPIFFRELVRYTHEYKYSWHTPGHMGGLAFLKSPAGRLFYDFFGENVFRSDLSVSVPELGSLLNHSGTEGQAEKYAAKIFGADQTFFVTNGTSTANKMVNFGCVKRGDVILLDRNCHKSLQHAITMTGAIPIYFIPTRNAYGIIGGITYKQFEAKHIRKIIKESKLIQDKKKDVALAVITNSTYDGLIYHVEEIEKSLSKNVWNMHFDEAWFAYAAFHPIYQKRYAMHPGKADCNVFATQSTHKLLAALSQSSMLHVKKGKKGLDLSLFNEAFMMHTSTSPQYAIIASLDVATKMMEGNAGKVLLEDTIEEAILFRKNIVRMERELSWWFSVWQPKSYGDKKFEELDNEFLINSSDFWTLRKNESWHGFMNLDDQMMMLDPIKVTLLTPGIDKHGKMEEIGIPAPIVAKFLRSKDIVDEKTGFYAFLFLFSIGVTKGKSSILLVELLEFKKAYDENMLIQDIFPDLAKEFSQSYHGITLRELCDRMHQFLREKDIVNLTETVLSTLPEQDMAPYEAYEKIVDNEVELVPISELEGRTLARMLVPYPPGIPLIMPGEKITKETRCIVEYFQLLEEFDREFPGFETDSHGIEVVDGKHCAHVINHQINSRITK